MVRTREIAFVKSQTRFAARPHCDHSWRTTVLDIDARGQCLLSFATLVRSCAKLQLEVPALAGQQRPGSTDAVSVVGGAVRMLTIAVFIVTMIGNAQRCFDLEQPIGDLRRVLNSAIIGAA